MVVTKEVLLIHPAWILLFLFCYVVAFYVFYKTCNLFIAAITLALCMIGSSYIIHSYYGLI